MATWTQINVCTELERVKTLKKDGEWMGLVDLCLYSLMQGKARIPGYRLFLLQGMQWQQSF